MVSLSRWISAIRTKIKNKAGMKPAPKLRIAGNRGLNFKPTEFASPKEAHAIARTLNGMTIII